MIVSFMTELQESDRSRSDGANKEEWSNILASMLESTWVTTLARLHFNEVSLFLNLQDGSSSSISTLRQKN